MKKAHLFLLLFLISHIIKTDDFSHFKGREWDFMEQIFVGNSTAKLKNIKKKAMLSTSILSSIGYFICLSLLFKKIIAKEPEFIPILFINSAACGFLTSIIAEYMYENSKTAAVFEKVGFEFLRHWPTYKQYTHQSFHNAFDELYAQYKKNEINKLFKEELVRVVSDVHQAIYNRFMQKYYRPQNNTYVFMH